MGNTVSQICHLCNGEGKEGGCTRCGLTPRKAASVKLLNLDMATDIIPIPYQGITWEKPEGDLPARFREFDDKLDKVYTEFLAGRIPKFSLFMAAPPKSNKNVFAYACMQTALAQKFTVAPMLSTADWRRLYKVSQMNPFYKLYGKYQWDTLIACDVLFLFIDHLEEHNDDINLLKNILDTRAAFNLPTFIISDYRLNDLVSKWDTQSYSLIHNASERRDYLRYPVILHRFE